MENNADILEELKTQTMWLKAIALWALKDVIQEELESPQDRKIFELSDGERTTREIAKATGVSFQTIAGKWKRWASLGLVTEGEKRKGRYKKIA